MKTKIWTAVVLILISFAVTLVIRLPGLNYGYFCWDEHDYIAHNIFNRLAANTYEIPYSNKWPAGHAIIYFLTRWSSPFYMASYRIASSFVDSLTAVLLAYLTVGFLRIRTQLLAAAFYALVVSVVLRSSAGIIVESMVNLPVVASAVVFYRIKSSRWAAIAGMLLLAVACLTKPTAFFPGLGLLAWRLWNTRSDRQILCAEMRWLTTSIVAIVLALLVAYFLGSDYLSTYLRIPGIVYNFAGHFGHFTVSNILLKPLTAFAFFQYAYPLIVLACYALLNHAKPHNLLPVFWSIGAFFSIVIPSATQTVYWLYLLPPLFVLAVDALRSIHSRTNKSVWWMTSLLVVAPLIYAWSVHIYGGPRSISFGQSGGIKTVQTQLVSTELTAAEIKRLSGYVPGHSRLFVWGFEHQLYFYAECIPASSILTSETWYWDVGRETQAPILVDALENKADFAVIDTNNLPEILNASLRQYFTEAGGSVAARLYVRKNWRH